MNTLYRALLTLVALAVLTPQPLRAADDGGTRSVFAIGAGNRALSLGSAYTALAEDASAPLWNPAGLRFMPRLQIMASRASLAAPGFQENFAAAALPSWRWGTLGFTFRHFGADGLDERDERNVILGDNLTDSEVEIGLSYAPIISEAWSVGGTVKLRRQSLAGYSAGGVGADLGLLMRPGAMLGNDGWLRHLNVGLTVFNAIEPTLRLDEEDVSDPRTLKLGLAYQLPMDLGRSVSAAMDLESSQGMSPRLHLGVEVRLHSMVALRTGLDTGFFTAGTGIEWKDFGIDYVFTDNPLGGEHRFGLTLTLGSTVDQRRLAARRADEAALQERMSEEYERRQAERLNTLLAEADAALAEARYEDVLRTVAMVNTLLPGDPEAGRLEIASWLGTASDLEQAESFTDAAVAYSRVLELAPGNETAITGQARCRTESDLRAARSEQVRERFARALDAFSKGDLIAARSDFAEVVRLDPLDTDAQAMLGRVEQAIAREGVDLLNEAERFTRAGLFAESRAAIRSARAMEAPSAGVRHAERALADAERAASRAAQASATPVSETRDAETVAAVTGPPPISAAKRNEAEELHQRGLKALEAGSSDDAIRYWELALSADPNHAGVQQYLVQEYLMRGMDAFAAGRLDAAVGFWERGLDIDPSDRKAMGYLARARDQLARTREILGDTR